MPKRVTGRHERTSVAGVAGVAGAGVLVETTGKKRDRSFVYQKYLDRLRVGTELASRER